MVDDILHQLFKGHGTGCLEQNGCSRPQFPVYGLMRQFLGFKVIDLRNSTLLRSLSDVPGQIAHGDHTVHTGFGKVAAHRLMEGLAIHAQFQHIAQGAEKGGVPQVYYFETQEQAHQTINRELRAGTSILLKASRAMSFEKLAQYIIDHTAEVSN